MPTQNPNVKYCPTCGQMLAAYLAVCPRCNTAQNVPTAAPQIVVNVDSGWGYGFGYGRYSNLYKEHPWVLVVVVAVVLSLFAWSFISSQWHVENEARRLNDEIIKGTHQRYGQQQIDDDRQRMLMSGNAVQESTPPNVPTDSGGTSQVFSPPPRDMPGSGGAAPYAPVQQYTPEEPNNRNAIPFGNRSLHGGAFGAQNGR